MSPSALAWLGRWAELLGFGCFALLLIGLTIYSWTQRRRAERRAAELIDLSQGLRRSEEALRESEERYMLAARGANDGLWDWNLATDQVHYSARWRAMLGLPEEAVVTDPSAWFGRVHPDDAERVAAEFAAHFRGDTPHFESEHRVMHADGAYRWMLSRALVVRDDTGAAHRIAGSQTDITGSKVAAQRSQDNAVHDALTGLPNRALITDLIFRAISRAERHPEYRFAVLFLDVDRFKVINDNLGHMVGDQLLVSIARRLEGCVRTEDSVGRLAGDEFTIFMDDIKDISDATHVADRVLKAMAEPFALSGNELFTSVSIGIALSTTGYSRPEEVLRDADVAMYRAKANGKARYQVFDGEMHARAVSVMQLESDLRRAIERDEFELYYQPIVSLSRGLTTGFEALLRWNHPSRGLFYPDSFIPLAEETGLIAPIGQWVLKEACRQTQAWQRRFGTHSALTVAVNISGREYAQPDLPQHIYRALADTGLHPRHLKIEITESIIMENAESALLTLKHLRALGVELHLDDFGTGYSSLSYLPRFPINALKIADCFVRKMSEEDESLEIVRAILTLARNLRMGVVAEGVETREQRAQLRALECDLAQGYLFAPPMSAEDAERALAQESARLLGDSEDIPAVPRMEVVA